MKLKTLKKLCKELSLHSLFVPGGTFSPEEVERLLTIDTIRYDLGKYKPESKNNDVSFPTPVWYVTRTCEQGPYIALYTYHIATYSAYVRQTGEEIQKLERISSIFDHMQKSKA